MLQLADAGRTRLKFICFEESGAWLCLDGYIRESLFPFVFALLIRCFSRIKVALNPLNTAMAFHHHSQTVFTLQFGQNVLHVLAHRSSGKT